MAEEPPGAQYRVFYRIVEADPPTLWDFTSQGAKGRMPPRADPETLRLWTGLSMWATEAQARRSARRYPALGRYIAELHVPEDAPIRVERTRGPGHHTLWGTPADLLTCVMSTVPLRGYTQAMYWELRTVPHADLVGESDDLVAMLQLAGECVDAGFPLDDLYICAEWDEGEAGDDADLPAVLAGAGLAARIRPAGAGRRTASA